jgi:hypothetical protein
MWVVSRGHGGRTVGEALTVGIGGCERFRGSVPVCLRAAVIAPLVGLAGRVGRRRRPGRVRRRGGRGSVRARGCSRRATAIVRGGAVSTRGRGG